MSGLHLTLKIWRQKDAKTKGQFETVKNNDVSPDMSFLEMLDIVNEEQMKQGKEGFAFDHDCREVHVQNYITYSIFSNNFSSTNICNSQRRLLSSVCDFHVFLPVFFLAYIKSTDK